VPPLYDPRRTNAGFQFPLEGRLFNEGRQMTIPWPMVQQWRAEGARAAEELAAMVPPRALASRMCGPPVWFFDAPTANEPNMAAMVSELAMQPNLLPSILESDA